jgi:hypothetical protein
MAGSRFRGGADRKPFMVEGGTGTWPQSNANSRRVLEVENRWKSHKGQDSGLR